MFCWDRTKRNDFKLEDGRIWLDIKRWGNRTGFPERWLKLLSGRHSRSGWTGPWANRSNRRRPCPLQGSWTRRPPKVRFNSNNSIIRGRLSCNYSERFWQHTRPSPLLPLPCTTLRSWLHLLDNLLTYIGKAAARTPSASPHRETFLGILVVFQEAHSFLGTVF